ncbi:TPA_asm: P [Gleditsia betacytorhabdovirus 1]|nr:TPA_asm: P [Gleditsia betacytorhabdovirus 1]
MLFPKIKKPSDKKSSVFYHGVPELLLVEAPDRLKDEDLPVVRTHSFLSAGQRKRRNRRGIDWAKDPNLTRYRMASARAAFEKEILGGELLDKTSHLEQIVEDLGRQEIPKSQTHFEIPQDFKMKTAPAVPLSGHVEWGLESDNDEEDDEKIFNEEIEKAKSESDLPIQDPVDLAIERNKSPRYGKGDSKTRSTSVGAEAGGRYNLRGKKMFQTAKDYYDILPKAEVMKYAKYAFASRDVKMQFEFSDQLMFLDNKMHGLSKSMIDMFLEGIIKERQISLSRTQEAITDNLSKSIAALAKQVDALKMSNETQVQICNTMIRNQHGKETPEISIPAKKVEFSSKVQNPTKVVYAPRSSPQRTSSAGTKEDMSHATWQIKNGTPASSSGTKTDSTMEEKKILLIHLLSAANAIDEMMLDEVVSKVAERIDDDMLNDLSVMCSNDKAAFCNFYIDLIP